MFHSVYYIVGRGRDYRVPTARQHAMNDCLPTIVPTRLVYEVVEAIPSRYKAI